MGPPYNNADGGIFKSNKFILTCIHIHLLSGYSCNIHGFVVVVIILYVVDIVVVVIVIVVVIVHPRNLTLNFG